MITTAFDVTAVAWSEFKQIPTRRGVMQLREWEITGDEFWDEWRKGNLKAQGYSVSKFKGVWKLTEWRTIEGGLTESAAQAREAIKDSDGQEALAVSYVPELTGDALAAFAKIEAKLLPYQRDHVKRLIVAATRYGSAVDTSDTGTGKTYSALAVAVAMGRRAFVIAPLQVLPSWRKAAEYLGADIVEAMNYERLRTGNTGYVTKNKKKFTWAKEAVDPASTIIIFDECHRMKDFSTQNCAMGVAALEGGYTTLALSATAADNPLQMKFVALAAKLIRRGDEFHGWVTQKAQGCRTGRFGLFFVGGRAVLSRLHKVIFPEHGSRIRIAELGDQFPETKIIAEAYSMEGATKEIRAVYEEMFEEIAKLEERQEKDRGASILTQQLRARQKAELLKVPTFCQMAEDAIGEGHSVAIFLNFDDSVTAMALRLGTVAVIRGGQSPEAREEIRLAFQRDAEKVIICNIRAGGVGISLHGESETSRTRLALISPTFSGQDLKQALGRVHRAGGARSVQKIVFAAGTVEEDACERVREKIERINTINDGELDQALTF